DSIQDMTSHDSSDTIAIISPHGLMLPDRVAIINTEFSTGKYDLKGGKLEKRYFIDRELALALKEAADDTADLVGYVTSSGPLSDFPLDFGSLIPLTFFGERRLVLMGQPRPRNVDRLFQFGKTLYSWSRGVDTKVGIIFSADQAHTHAQDGPYGFSEEAEKYDSEIASAIEENDFSKVRELQPEFISKAKPDSFWNMIALAGFLEASGLRMKVNYYYVEHYFGMMAASVKHA
ncbi:hypothetical protein B2A_07902, partial [mine drainage metagenome]